MFLAAVRVRNLYSTAKMVPQTMVRADLGQCHFHPSNCSVHEHLLVSSTHSAIASAPQVIASPPQNAYSEGSKNTIHRAAQILT